MLKHCQGLNSEWDEGEIPTLVCIYIFFLLVHNICLIKWEKHGNEHVLLQLVTVTAHQNLVNLAYGISTTLVLSFCPAPVFLGSHGFLFYCPVS